MTKHDEQVCWPGVFRLTSGISHDCHECPAADLVPERCDALCVFVWTLNRLRLV